MSTSKKDILDEATQVVAGRGKSYGAPEDNFNRIARLWNAHLENRYPTYQDGGVARGVQLDAQDVSMMMALMKIARLENDPAHHDSWVDVAGYAACGGELAARLRDDRPAPGEEQPETEDAVDELLRRARVK